MPFLIYCYLIFFICLKNIVSNSKPNSQYKKKKRIIFIKVKKNDDFLL